MDISLITGGTGHLGINLIHQLLQKNGTVILLVRPDSIKRFGGLQDLVRTIKKCGTKRSPEWISRRIKVVTGDITKAQLGLDQKEYRRLSKEVRAIFHSAALLDFMAPLESLRAVNVEGTKNLLDFGLSCADRAEFQGVNYISTFAVAGTAAGTFYESDLDCGQQFNNGYEQSKFEAEKLAGVYRTKGLPISIFRPSIIVGNSKTGQTRSFETLYKPLHFLSLGLYDQIPADGRTRFNLVPVDSVAEVINRIVEKNGIKNLTYHLVNDKEIDCEFLIKVASRHFGFREPKLIPDDQFDHTSLNGFRRRMLAPYIPYLNRGSIVWDAENVRNAIRDAPFSWPIVDEQLLGRLFDFCLKVGFIKARGKNTPVTVNPVASSLDS